MLGSIEVLVPQGSLAIGPPQRKAVLAALLVDIGRPVPPEVLIDRVWNEPPDGARRTLHAHITRLRKLLGHAGQPVALVRRSTGYVVEAPPEYVDLHRFRHLVRSGQTSRQPEQTPLESLREALTLWHGTPLADVPGNWAARVREGLLRQRLDAAALLADAHLQLGDYPSVITMARELLVTYPLAEPMQAALMHGLVAAGREAEALETYAMFRARLRDELGTEPGTQLQNLHQAILRADLAPPLRPLNASTLPHAAHMSHPAVTPTTAPRGPAGTSGPAAPPVDSAVPHVALVASRNLPRDLPDFTGREQVLRALLEAIPSRGQSATAPTILAIDGMPGVGKTALAIHAAHLIADQYPDAQLFIDLLGHSVQAPLDAATALDALLRQLGVPGERIPDRLDERIVQWRGALATRRVLLLLDNAAGTDQIAAILPADPGCLTLITSRRRLGGLDGATALDLGLFSMDEALLLQQRIAGDQVTGAPQAAQDVARRCGHLPLAVRLVAARLAHRPGWSMRDLADHLASTQTPLRQLALQGRTVEAAFALSYQQLSPAAQTLFRRLGLHPGPDVGTAAVAALAHLDLPDTDELLTELVDAHLVEEPTAGRYRLHDLLRDYAARLATADPAAERHQAIVPSTVTSDPLRTYG